MSESLSSIELSSASSIISSMKTFTCHRAQHPEIHSRVLAPKKKYNLHLDPHLLDATLTSTLCNGYHDQMVTGDPIPRTFDVQKRIQQLRGYLDPNDPNYQPEQQHTNIKAAIKLYEDGKKMD
jgi:hypothetical protein